MNTYLFQNPLGYTQLIFPIMILLFGMGLSLFCVILEKSSSQFLIEIHQIINGNFSNGLLKYCYHNQLLNFSNCLFFELYKPTLSYKSIFLSYLAELEKHPKLVKNKYYSMRVSCVLWPMESYCTVNQLSHYFHKARLIGN